MTVDLSVEPGLLEPLDRRRLGVLEFCPDGARVIVDIGRRRLVSQDAATFLHEHDHRLDIEVRGEDPVVVRRFVQAARVGVWEVA